MNYVYDRYIEMLQYNKNASIDTILREDFIRDEIQKQLRVDAQGHIVQGYTEKDIEQAVIDKLY